MAIVPFLVDLAREMSDYRDDFDHLLDDDFGYGIHPVDIFRPRSASGALMLHPRRRRSSFSPYERPLWLARRGSNRLHKLLSDATGAAGDGAGALSLPTVSKDGFQVCMDVSQFKPNELTVKTVDNQVVVEGKHEEREDEHGVIQRHFVRKYILPKDYDAKEVVSTISSDGVLTVKAPPPPNKAIKSNERIVQIQQTGPAHLNVKAPESQQQQDVQNGAIKEKEKKK